MSDIGNTIKTSKLVETQERYILFTADDVSQNDTITIDSVTTIHGSAIFNRETGAEITCTEATNVITVTGAATNVLVVGLAVGE
jgi:hypothetical protein